MLLANPGNSHQVRGSANLNLTLIERKLGRLNWKTQILRVEQPSPFWVDVLLILHSVVSKFVQIDCENWQVRDPGWDRLIQIQGLLKN